MTDSEIRTCLQDRLRRIEERILSACQRSGRPRSAVTLIAVTKTVGARVARLLPELGIRDLGESRPQELVRKAKDFEGLEIRWHLIGHLQRNKIEATIPRTVLVHSVDSLRLLEALDQQKVDPPLPILLEVNASREENKHGFAPEQIAAVIAVLENYPHVHVTGLMTMAAYSNDAESARPTFAEVSTLGKTFQLADLSMGMSNDFEVAIEEGSTLIRLGTILFEGLENER